MYVFVCIGLSSAETVPIGKISDIEASSTGFGSKASFALDNNAETRWSSGNDRGPVELKISFKEECTVSSLRIFWETAAASIYDIQVSNDGRSWKTVSAVNDGMPEEDRIIKFAPVSAKFIKIVARKRATRWDYSIWEIEINPEIEKPRSFYVDAVNGSDGNNGRSPEKAWKTISRVNREMLRPGDKVHFKRGGIFRGFLNPKSGSSAGGYITYTDYGKGDKPRILGSLNKNRKKDWRRVNNNIWVHSPKDAKGRRVSLDDLISGKCDDNGILWPEIGNLIFDNEKSCGRKRYSLRDLVRQDDFYYDEKTLDLYVYSEGNPAEVHSVIECAPRDYRETKPSLTLTNKSYIVFENLDWRYYGRNLTYYGANSHHIIIRHCEEHYSGGSRQPGLPWSDKMRHGGGFSTWDCVHDYLFEGNLVRHCYDGALSFETAGDNSEVYNITYINNIVMNGELGFTYFVFGKNCKVSNVLVANNTFMNCGYSWGSGQRPDGQLGLGINDFSVDPTAEVKNFRIVNNVVYNSRHFSLRFQADVADFDYNIYYSTTGKLANFMGKWYEFIPYNQFTKYKNFLGQDPHSMATNPLLDNSGRLLSGSPCIDSGINLEEVKYDYFGNPRDSRTDIGACEFIK